MFVLAHYTGVVATFAQKKMLPIVDIIRMLFGLKRFRTSLKPFYLFWKSFQNFQNSFQHRIRTDVSL